jgi:hypothetical protein
MKTSLADSYGEVAAVRAETEDTRTVAVSADFLSAFAAGEICEKLTGWKVPAPSQPREARSRLDITFDGIAVESDAV